MSVVMKSGIRDGKRRTRAIEAMLIMLSLIGIPTRAQAETSLSLTNFFDMLVDAPRQHVFVSGGTGNSSLLVLNFDGTINTTIPNMPSGAGMVLDGTTLYVARENGAAIDTVDAVALEKTGTINLPTATGGFIAKAGGKLWFQAGACGTWSHLGSLDLTTLTVTTYSQWSFSCPAFATTPTNSDLLIVGELYSSPATLYKFDVSTDPPTLDVRVFSAGPENMKTMVITEDGSTLLTASGYPYYIPEFRVSDFQPTGMTYPTGPYPNAVDSKAGYVLGGVYAPYSPDVYVFPAGTSTASQTYAFASSSTLLADRGLAFSPDAAWVFAVTTDVYGSVFAFQVLPGPGTSAPKIIASAAIRFGAVPVGSASPLQKVTVKNGGTASLTLGNIVLGGAKPEQFKKPAVKDLCSGQMLAPDATCTVAVRFKPQDGGAQRASLMLPSNDPEASLVAVALKGTGSGPEITVSPTSLAFSTVQVGSVSPLQKVTVRNDGTTSLILGSIMLGGANPNQFKKPAAKDLCSGQTLAPAATCTVGVRFKPTSADQSSATLLIPSNDFNEGNSVSVTLDGTGL